MDAVALDGLRRPSYRAKSIRAFFDGKVGQMCGVVKGMLVLIQADTF